MIYLTLIPLAIILIASRLIYMKKNKIKFSFKDLFILIFFCYLLILLKITLLKDIHYTLNVKATIKQANLIPLLNIESWKQFGYNIGLLLPFGLFFCYFFPNKRNYLSLLIYGGLVALMIETLQLFKLTDFWDVNDIICYTLGFILGASFYKLIRHLLSKFKIKNQVIHSNLSPIKISWLCFTLMTISYFGIITTILNLDTLPISILDNKEVFTIDKFKFTSEETTDTHSIDAYYQMSFNRLIPCLYLETTQLEQPFYDIYILTEPYSPPKGALHASIIVGWNNEASIIEMNYEEQIYREEIPMGFFAIPYPELLENPYSEDIDSNIQLNLTVTFYDESDNIVDIHYATESDSIKEDLPSS